MTADAYRFVEDPADLDLDRVHHWLATDAYWALGRPREITDRAFAASVVMGVYRGGEQVAVARMVSDGVLFGWLCDVYVDRGHRGQGIGKRLAQWAADWGRERGLRRVMLATRDAHLVYASAGFAPLEVPGDFMALMLRSR